LVIILLLFYFGYFVVYIYFDMNIIQNGLRVCAQYYVYYVSDAEKIYSYASFICGTSFVIFVVKMCIAL